MPYVRVGGILLLLKGKCWKLEKESLHVCGRVLFLIFLRCRFQGVHFVLAIQCMSWDRIFTRSHVQINVHWMPFDKGENVIIDMSYWCHLIKVRTWSSTCLIESVLRRINSENNYQLVPFKLFLMTRLWHFRKSLFTPSLRNKT